MTYKHAFGSPAFSPRYLLSWHRINCSFKKKIVREPICMQFKLYSELKVLYLNHTVFLTMQ